MTPLEFLREEVTNVRNALNETLRHDYAPGQGREYYAECANRLSEIDVSVANTPDSAAAYAIALTLHLKPWEVVPVALALDDFRAEFRPLCGYTRSSGTGTARLS